MALYLCKMDPNNPTPSGDARLVGVLGRIVESGDGVRFISNVSSHGSSRKVWKSALECIPRWAENHGFTQLLDKQELDEVRKATADTPA